MTPDQFARRIAQAKRDGDLIDRLSAAMAGVPAADRLLALTAMQAECILIVAGENPAIAKALWEVTMKQSAVMLERMMAPDDERVH